MLCPSQWDLHKTKKLPKTSLNEYMKLNFVYDPLAFDKFCPPIE